MIDIGRKMSFEPLLEVKEAAALLKVHPVTLRKLAAERRIPAIKLGDGKRAVWRFRSSDLDEWLRTKSRAAILEASKP